MSTGFPHFHSVVAAEVESIRRCWGWLLFWGALLVLAGVAAIAYPLVITVVSMEIFGILLLIGGGVQLASTFTVPRWGGKLMSIICACMYFFAGIVFLDRPVLAAAGFTLFLAMFFLATGAARIVAGLTHKFSGWGWAVLNGVVSIALAIMIWRDLPEAAIWVIGTFVGVDLIFGGWSWIMLGLGLKQLPAKRAV